MSKELADQIEALTAKATPGPYAIASEELEGDHKTIIERPSRSGMFGVPLLRAEHDWEESRISWAQAENLTSLVHSMLVNLPAIITALRSETEATWLRAMIENCPARHAMHGCPTTARAALRENTDAE